MSTAGSSRGDRLLGALLGGAIGAAPGVLLLVAGDAVGGGGGRALAVAGVVLALAGLIDGVVLGAQRASRWRARPVPPAVWAMGVACAAIIGVIALRAFG